jgi:hypothetical protein
MPVVAMGKEVIFGYDKPQYISRVAIVYVKRV